MFSLTIEELEELLIRLGRERREDAKRELLRLKMEVCRN